MPGENKIVIDDIAVEFLQLVRDYYHITDAANYFLEGRTGESGINIAIANQRDVLSHLVTLLSNGSLTEDERRGQLANAEEHLRRSIVEPYQRAVEIKNDQFRKLDAVYKKKVVPLIENNSLENAPNLTSISARHRHYMELYADGRNSKHRNLWDAQWNVGVMKFQQSFEIVEELVNDMDKYISIAEAKVRSKWDNIIKWSGWVIGIAGVLLTVVIAVS